MTNNNNAVNAHANVTDAVKELAAMADRELRSDARKAHRDVTEAVEELLAECYRLRAELKTALAERDEAKGTITRMRDGYEGCCPLCETVGILNVKLLAERDDARREVCELRMPCVGSQRGYAKGRGWDCYKEESK